MTAYSNMSRYHFRSGITDAIRHDNDDDAILVHKAVPMRSRASTRCITSWLARTPSHSTHSTFRVWDVLRNLDPMVLRTRVRGAPY